MSSTDFYTFFFLGETKFKLLFHSLRPGDFKNVSFLAEIVPNSIDSKTDTGRVKFEGSEEYIADFSRVPKMELLSTLGVFYGFMQCDKNKEKKFICEHIVKMNGWDEREKGRIVAAVDSMRRIMDKCGKRVGVGLKEF